jgi:hypothetical protein
LCEEDGASEGVRNQFAIPSSAIVFQEQHDETSNRHQGKVDDRLDRTFAVKPLAFGAPPRGFGA